MLGALLSKLCFFEDKGICYFLENAILPTTNICLILISEGREIITNKIFF